MCRCVEWIFKKKLYPDGSTYIYIALFFVPSYLLTWWYVLWMAVICRATLLSCIYYAADVLNETLKLIMTFFLFIYSRFFFFCLIIIVILYLFPVFLIINCLSLSLLNFCPIIFIHRLTTSTCYVIIGCQLFIFLLSILHL